MTPSMTPSEGPDELGTTQPLSVDDDAFVHDLLSSLPPVTMPPDVVARLNAALAAERMTTSGTVVPLAQARRRRLDPRVLSAAAAVVLVLGGGYAVLHGRSASSGSDATAAGAQPAAAYSVAQTGTRYSTVALENQVHTLVAHQAPAVSSAGEGTSTSAPPSFSSTDTARETPNATASSGPTGPADQHSAVAAPLSALVSSPTSLQGCLAAVEKGAPPSERLVAVDAGTYDGQPALVVVVLPSETSSTFGVYIVSPACEARDAHLIAFHFVKRS